MEKLSINKCCTLLKQKFPDLIIKTNKTFKDLTSFKIGGKIKCLIEISSINSLLQVMEILTKNNIEYFILGFGTNILASNKTFNKVVLKICLKEIKVKGSQIICGAGVGIFKLNQIAIENSLSGLEWSYGIPGSVGGAIKMNAGSFGGEIKDVVKTVYYTAILQINKDGEWVDVTAENNPADGAVIVLPYPEGTKDSSHEFVVYKMKTQGSDAGIIEVWAHTEKVEGLEITLSQGDPLIVAYAPTSRISKGLVMGIGGAAVAVIAVIVFLKLLKKDREDTEEILMLEENNNSKE